MGMFSQGVCGTRGEAILTYSCVSGDESSTYSRWGQNPPRGGEVVLGQVSTAVPVLSRYLLLPCVLASITCVFVTWDYRSSSAGG